MRSNCALSQSRYCPGFQARQTGRVEGFGDGFFVQQALRADNVGMEMPVARKPLTISETSSQTKTLARAFLKMAIKRIAIKSGIVTVNAAALADPPKLRHQKRSRMTQDDLGRILDAQPNAVLRAMYLTIATTGLRIAEARNLTWNEIIEREDGMWIKLTHSKTDEGLKPIPIASETWKEIEALGKTSVCVFPSNAGTPIGESNFRRAWVLALQRAGVAQTNAYQLRKLFGSVKARTESEDVLKDLMRHKDARTTHQFYVEPFDEDLRAAVEK